MFANESKQWVVDSSINRLAKRSTSIRDVLHFYAELLDSLHHWCHHVAFIGIQHKQQNNNYWCYINVGFESFLNLINQCTLVHPCMFPAIILTTGWKIWELFTMQSFWVLWKISFGGNFVPSIHRYSQSGSFCIICSSVNDE